MVAFGFLHQNLKSPAYHNHLFWKPGKLETIIKQAYIKKNSIVGGGKVQTILLCKTIFLFLLTYIFIFLTEESN